MNKITKVTLVLLFILINLTCFEQVCRGAGQQPAASETKLLEHSLDLFSKKIVSKNKVINLQYKRYGRKAVISFDMIKPNEVLFMLYLLEYNDGDWRISKEYHYSKTIVAPSSASVC
jgi:hypothetical protein